MEALRNGSLPWSARLVGVVVLGAGALGGVVCAEPSGPLTPRQVVERVGAAVVVIEAKKGDQTGSGSGFVTGDDRSIVTSLHVIDGADRLEVIFRDGTRSTDVVVRSFDVERDLAVLAVTFPEDGPAPAPLVLGDTTTVGPGTKILVIGNPLGLDQTVTEGIVSAWREPPSDDADEEDDRPSSAPLLPPCRLVQISADISPGSSGGPVLDERAEVIGVAKAGIRGASGLNFAVPVDELHRLVAEDGSMDLGTFQDRADDARRELAEPWLDRARTAYERDDRVRAGRHLERALLIFPRSRDTLVLAGRIALEAGEMEVAEERLLEAVEIDDDHAESWYLLGRLHHLRASEEDDSILLSTAETEYRKALDRDGRHSGAAYHLALIAVVRGNRREAEDLLLLAIDSELRFPEAHYTLGEIYFSQNRVNEAREEFEQVLWEDEDNALGHFGLARVAMAMDRIAIGSVSPHGAATEHWEEFLRLSEGDPALADKRHLALSIIRAYYPHLLER